MLFRSQRSALARESKSAARLFRHTGVILVDVFRSLRRPGGTPHDWESLCRAWGLWRREREIRALFLRNQRARAIFVGIALLFCLEAITTSSGPIAQAASAAVALCAAYLATRCWWRMHCIRTRQYVAFLAWLRGQE